MTNEKRQKESLILIALAKAFSEQATLLIGENKHKVKQTFNQAVKSTDLFIKTIEDTMDNEQKEYLASIGDLYHNINLEIRKHGL